MKKLLELISNDDGRLSRTQVFMSLCILFTMAVIITDIVKGGTVLNLSMLIALGGLNGFCIADRINVRHLSFKIGKGGVQVSASEKPAPGSGICATG